MAISFKVFYFVIDKLVFKVFTDNERIVKIDLEFLKNNSFKQEIPDLLKDLYCFYETYFRYGEITKVSLDSFKLYLSDKEKRVFSTLTEATKIGCTITYKELGILSGFGDKSSRFVGNLLSKNPLPIIFPCHRVIKSDGDIGGYKWGKEIKRYILQKEKEFIENKLNFKFSLTNT